MTSAKLIKTLEKEGFFLEFPSYDSIEEIIIEIIKEGKERLNASLTLFLNNHIDYRKIIGKLNIQQKKELDKIIFISEKIYTKENINNETKKTINENHIKSSFTKEEFNNFYDSFKEAQLRKNNYEQKIIEKQSKLRLNLDLNKSLTVLFSPAKIKIMEKIFNHQKLTNTELKYYYRAISNIDKSILNPSLQDYLRVIEITRKEK
jgi:hypothetical protein